MRGWGWLLLGAACGGVEPEPTCDGLDANGDGVCDADGVDWSSEARVPTGTDRGNLYGLSEDELTAVRTEGLGHTLVWPVSVSGLLLPYRALTRFLDPTTEDPAHRGLLAVASNTLGFGDLPSMYAWLGLPPLPPEGQGIPHPEGQTTGDPMGVGVIATEYGDALTFSCAACHASSVFGTTVMGLTNRKARANEFFHMASLFFPSIPAELFAQLSGADEGEVDLFLRTQANLPAVGARRPEVLGLDTSLAQVSLSLARREPDAWATRSDAFQLAPRENLLESFVADSKPAVWWTLKHKTRWLSDGSIVSGNPIFTNFLWNEIGRATDLHELETWLKENRRVVDTLTAAVFATEPPRWTAVLPQLPIDEDAARRGEAHFEAMCASCHGSYEKAWDDPDASTAEARLVTVGVNYHERTPVMDVGTDSQRAEGMVAFAEGLNGLRISGEMGTVVEVQSGYVPPPLTGVWSRYPYLHNGSVPSLCALLRPASERPAVFYVGTTDDAATDLDADCVGFPVGDAAPEAWTSDERRRHDTSQPGLSNRGHEDMLLDNEGNEILDEAGRADLIAYLKAL